MEMDIISFRSLSSYYSHVCVDEIDRKITNSQTNIPPSHPLLVDTTFQ